MRIQRKRVLVIGLLFALVVGLFPWTVARAADPMTVDSLTGPITQNEINSFKAYMQTVEPVVWPNTGSMQGEYAQGKSGENIKALGLMYELTGDTAILDRMIYFCDVLLSQRNDLLPAPYGQRTVWTNTIAPVWPGNNTGTASADSANGDPVGHLAYCGKLILQTPAIWNTTVPVTDTYGHGATYRQRAATFVNEADYVVNQFILPSLLDLSQGNKYYFSAQSPYMTGAIMPWNQQMMISYGLQNLAAAHAIIGDNPTLVSQYDNIVQTNLNWFFSNDTAKQTYTNSKGNTTYNWGYNPTLLGGEDSNHASLDVAGFYRAFLSGRYGITASMMMPFANMYADVMMRSANDYAGRVDGTDGTGHGAPTTYPRNGNLFLAALRPDMYTTLANASLQNMTSTSMATYSRLMWVKKQLNQGGSASNLALGKTYSASTTWSASYAADKAFDGSTSTRWSAASGSLTNQWLSVDFGTSTTFDQVMVKEASFQRVTAYKLQSSNDGTTFTDIAGTAGTTIGASKTINFTGVSARYLRLFVTSASDVPTIDEMEVYRMTTSGGSDTQAPTVPTGVTALASSSSQINLSWNASTDNVGVTGYDVYRGGTLVGSAASTSYSDTGLAASTAYSYTIKARDAAGNSSAASSTTSATTLAAGGNAALGKAYSASTTWSTSYPAANAFDGDTATRWSASSGSTANQWISVDLGSAMAVNQVIVKETTYQRVTSYKLQSSSDGSTFTDIPGTSGTTLGASKTISFSPVTMRYVRLYVSTASAVPTINEIEVYTP
ncbi:discoidin domain-containing protein [Paenibacillus whitsoniae]|nr:discoidin domain-containing protein [Paenibacillus whitsoniae]